MPFEDNFFDNVVNDKVNTIEELANQSKRGKGGRPGKAETGLNKSATAYLTEDEKTVFQKKLEGIPEATWLRNTILKFINKK